MGYAGYLRKMGFPAGTAKVVSIRAYFNRFLGRFGVPSGEGQETIHNEFKKEICGPP
jgi:hypothetical protein